MPRLPSRQRRFAAREVDALLRARTGATEQYTVYAWVSSETQAEAGNATQELVADRLSIVTCFAARLYGRRSQQFRRKVRQAAKEEGRAFRYPTAEERKRVAS